MGGIENAELTSYAQNPPDDGRRTSMRSEERIAFIQRLYEIFEFCQKNLHFTKYQYSVYMNTTTPGTIDNIRNIVDVLNPEDKKTIAVMIFFQ